MSDFVSLPMSMTKNHMSKLSIQGLNVGEDMTEACS